MKNMINWFEIPVKNFDRAKKFYETIMDWKINDGQFGGFRMGSFPMDEGKVSGAIVQGNSYEPSQAGALVYLNCHPDLSLHLAKVEGAGGKIEMPKRQISPEIGFMAIITDTEGNRIALHSQQ